MVMRRDGQSHSVDSNDIAFRTAAKMAVLESMMTSIYDDQLNKWHEDFAASVDSNGGLDASEMEQLRKQWNDIVNAASGQWQSLKDTFGWDDTSATGQQQSATSRAFGTEMTQEQGAEISGRLTAVAESNYRIEGSIASLKEPVSQLAAQSQGMISIADEARTILAQSYIELQGIRENTGAIVKPIQQMQLDIAAVKQNTARI